MQYDLEERTAVFGENILSLVKTIPNTIHTRPLISQLIRSATSIGANYMEANGASSKKDFRNKISISRKEARETKYWLRMVKYSCSAKERECVRLWKEAHELTLIFSKILQKS